MADTKITALTALTGADPANDVIPIVDVSDTTMAASGTTKKISVNNILGASGTATLASATITGAANFNGGALAAYLNGSLMFGSSGNTVNFFGQSSGFAFKESTGVNNLLTINTGGFVFGDGAGGTRMTLNATGLGVGASPSYQLHVSKSQASATTLFVDNQQNNAAASSDLSLSAYGGNWNLSVPHSATFVNPLIFKFGSTERMRITSDGNLGIGVTPSAWFSNYKALQVNATASVSGFSSGSNQNTRIANNWFSNAAGTDTYIQSNFATVYQQNQGVHSWLTAPSGTAGNAITFTQAMTLAANGQLLLGTSSTNGGVDIGMVMNKPSATGFVGNVYQLNGVDKAFAYIASAASAYTTETVSGYIIRAVSATNGVYLANGGTSWLALSDERFKDIIEPISNAVAKVGSLRSVIGKFKTESEGTRRSFLIAQDVQAVLPEAVDATKPDQLGVSYSDVIPLLVAAIKELTARVQTLETR